MTLLSTVHRASGNRQRAFAVLAASALCSVSIAVIGPSVASASSSTTPSTHMVPAVLAGLSLAKLEGPASASQPMEIGVSVARPDTAGELSLYSELYDPSSPQYHHFLTPAQFDQQFGLPASEQSAVSQWLTSDGLSIETASPGGDYYLLTGTVAQLDQLFRVQIGAYTFNGQTFLANNIPPSVPSDLPIDAVAGLDTLRQFSPSALTPSGPATTSQTGVQKVLTPRDLWGVYNDPTNDPNPSDLTSPEHSSVDFGQGQTTGIFGEGETSSVVDQLRLFEQNQNLPKVPVRTIETQGGPDSAYGDNTGSVEWYLDTQAITGMAPDLSQLDLYFSKSLYDADIFQSFSYWANDPNGPRQMNASFGECEENPTNPVTGPLSQQPYGTEFGDELEAVAEPILRQATLEGRTLFASAGDTGSGCPELVAPVIGAGNGLAVQPVPMVSYPCDSAYAVCVGGTVVSVKGSSGTEAAERAAETSWTFGGGGPSHFIPAPSFQHGVAHVDTRCISTPAGVPYDPLTAPICRGVPDVADMSGNVTGDAYFIYIDGEPSSEGGTSLSSPLMVGQWTRVQAGAPRAVQAAGGLGFADETIYEQALHGDYHSEFYDITQSEYGVGNGAYRPGPGWDYASGWGALNVANFIAAVDHDPTGVARAIEGPVEKPAVRTRVASMTGPTGDATDPLDVSLGNDPSLNITQAGLTASASKGIVATLSGPDLGALPPDGQSASFYVMWLYNGTVYFAQANESNVGSWTFSSGSTAGGTYADTANTAATGSVAAGTITIHIPLSEVGSPPFGAHLTVPQAMSTLDVGSTEAAWESFTADSADDIVPASVDLGAADSVGVTLLVTR